VSPRNLLPLISLLTIVVLAGTTELIARWKFKESPPFNLACMGPVDPVTGVRALPNCACWDKGIESQWVEYRFNNCGHRAGIECGAKPTGVYRIVMTGSSFAMGHHIQRERSFAALLPTELSRETGRTIELYNASMVSVTPHVAALRMDDVLSANPDMILLIITPFDVEKEGVQNLPVSSPMHNSSVLAKFWFRVRAAFSSKPIPDAFKELFDIALEIVHPRSVVMLRHYLFESRSQYLRSTLIDEDDSSGFLRAKPSAAWRERLQLVDRDVAEIARRTKTAGVPLAVALVPSRAGAAMIPMSEWPAGFDPFKLDNELRSITETHGGIYIDILPDFRNLLNPERHYFPVDGHPDAEGHALISRFLTMELTNGSVPALRIAGQPQEAWEQAR